MPATWPGALPQFILVSGHQEDAGDGRLISSMDTGPGKMRNRSSAIPRPLKGTMEVTTAQSLVLDSFVATSIGRGVLPFLFPVARLGGAVLVRFAKDGLPTYTALGGGRYVASLGLEILP